LASTQASKRPEPAGRGAISFWRHRGARNIAIQAVFLVAVVAVIAYFYNNMIRGLNELGLTFGYRFLGLEAGFAISEGIAYQPSDSYARALLVGIVNTVKVTLAGIVAASLIGLVVGVASLSSNWLVRSLARVYVEVFRNVPLLLQLLFWYSAVILKLPPVRQSVEVFRSFFLNQRGLYLPRLIAGQGFSSWLWFAGLALVAGVAVYFGVRRRLKRLDRPGFPSLWALGTTLLIAALGWFLVPHPPLDVDPPVLQRFNFTGGMHLSPEFAAILLGLSVYTGAFIAEVVRGGIQAVDRGQSEAALALGLRPWAVMYLVVLPQALRVIVPPVTSQYLNLAKNSSLAVAIGYPELFNVGTTIMNQTGQTLPVFTLIMACYLSLSLITSAFMNWYNRKMRLDER
jgi:amine acid ABC transporter, permease protein, 3-TM region, His/Glu/Gln/Arg/opine family